MILYLNDLVTIDQDDMTETENYKQTSHRTFVDAGKSR